MKPVNRIASEEYPMISPYLLKPLRTEAQALRDLEASWAHRPRAGPPARPAPAVAPRPGLSGPAEVLVRALSSRGRNRVPGPGGGRAPFSAPAGGRKAA